MQLSLAQTSTLPSLDHRSHKQAPCPAWPALGAAWPTHTQTIPPRIASLETPVLGSRPQKKKNDF